LRAPAAPAPMARQYEVVLHGATGFTGGLCAQYLCRQRALRWAVSGRSAARLHAVVAALEHAVSKPDVLEVDIEDAAALRRVAASTAVILSMAGPFAKVGTPVLEACVAEGTSYCDITGEVPWVRQQMERLGAEAARKGVTLVSCSGFDSVPSDLGALYGVGKLRERYGANTQVGSVSNYVQMRGGLSGGTLASGINMEKDPELARLMADPFALGGCPRSGVRDCDQDVTAAAFDDKVAAWTAPFGMATINTRIVRRSNMLCGYGGDAFQYRETQLCANESEALKLARGGPPADKRAELVQSGRLPKPGEGPSKEMRQKSWFRCLLRVEAAEDPNKVVYVRVSGGDPGYDETAKMAAETALVLARNADLLPRRGGFLTPAAAGGTALIEALQRAGIVFEQVRPPRAEAKAKM
jgi:short subunit dehydrogenase-like uncharacterized protein